jgi:hypothetical protein
MTNNCCSGSSEVVCDCSANRENKLCELTKFHNQFNVEKIKALVNEPKFMCHCCGRLANEAENLCRPHPLGNRGF